MWHGTELWAHGCSHYSGPLMDGLVVAVRYGNGPLEDGPILVVRYRNGPLTDGPIVAVRYGNGPFLVAHNDKPVYGSPFLGPLTADILTT